MATRTEPDIPDYITPGEASRLSFVSTRTLTRLADRGDIETVRLPSGHRRYSRADVLALLTSSSPAVPDNPHVGAAGGHVTPERKAS